MFGNQEDNESNKYGEMHIRRYNLWIEVICLDGMNDGNHRDEREHDGNSSISITENEDRNSGDKSTEYRDKSTDKFYERKGNDKGESITMKYTYKYESYGREDGIYEGYDRLCLENKSKSCPNFSCNNCPFVIEKFKISISNLSEKGVYSSSFDEKEV